MIGSVVRDHPLSSLRAPPAQRSTSRADRRRLGRSPSAGRRAARRRRASPSSTSMTSCGRPCRVVLAARSGRAAGRGGAELRRVGIVREGRSRSPPNQQAPTFSAIRFARSSAGPGAAWNCDVVSGAARLSSAASGQCGRERAAIETLALTPPSPSKPAARPSNSGRPSSPPCAASVRSSGCGIMPSTLPRLVQDAGDVAAASRSDWCPRHSGRRRGPSPSSRSSVASSAK